VTNAFLLGEEYKNYIEALGMDSEKIYKLAGIPLNPVKEGQYINRKQYINLMNAMDKFSDEDSIILYTDVSKVASFSPPLFAGLCARNGMEGIRRISQYKKLIGPFILKIEQNEEEMILTFTFDDEENTPLPKFTQITENLIILNIIRTGTGKKVIPKKIEATFTYPEKVSDYLGIEAVKSDENRMYFSISDMEEPFLTKNNVMWNYLQPEFDKRILEMETDTSIAAKVRTLLMELIPSGTGNIETVSKEMALSTRSLQRKLSEEKTTFIKQLNHTRELMAKNYLMNNNISTEEISYLIGYSDVYVFMRAFKQWTGFTVKQYKEKHIVI
jgi:AraC-like DNA-binding protein